MKNKQINIYEDHIQKRIEDLDNQINANCLKIYNEYKVNLEELYISQDVIAYEVALMEYNVAVDEVNSALYKELQRIEETCVPVKTIDLADIYFCSTKQ